MTLKAIWAQNTPYSKFLLAVGIILICAIFCTMLALAAGSALFGIPLGDLETQLNNLDNPASIAMLKFVQVVYAFGSFLLPALVLAYVFDARPMHYLGLARPASIATLLTVTFAILCALPLINFLGELNSHLSLPAFLSGLEDWMKSSEEKAAQLLEKFLATDRPADMLFNVFMIGLLPAIGEELLFRGIVQRLFIDLVKNVHASIWITAILFSALHMQFYGFLPRMLLGAWLGYLFVWSGSLWLPIVAHFVNNTAAIVLTWLYQEQVIGLDADAIGTQNDTIAVAVSLVFTISLTWLIYRRQKMRTQDVAA